MYKNISRYEKYYFIQFYFNLVYYCYYNKKSEIRESVEIKNWLTDKDEYSVNYYSTISV